MIIMCILCIIVIIMMIMIHSLSPSAACALRKTSENQDLSKGLLRYESDFKYTKRPLNVGQKFQKVENDENDVFLQ